MRRWDADVIDAAQQEYELPESSEAFTLQPGEAVIFKGSGSWQGKMLDWQLIPDGKLHR